ncbi:MAG: MFS transporter [Ignavibacteriae bacterium]|nr:MFS transporter [Ignavibacteriota bacterium]NOG98311.1 MFS transporter [Ignavibacteriota bacterium]
MLSMQKNLTNVFYSILSLPATAMGFALSIQIAALSWLLSTQYGLEIHDVGLVWAAGPIAGILGQVIIGLISDKVWFWNGRRRPFIFIGGFLAALMLLALPNIGVITTALGFDGILGVAIVVALTLDLAINISFNPTRSIIADVTPEGVERTKGYAWMQTISGTFGVGAYVIGAVWDNYILIYTGVVLVLILSVVPTFFIEEPRELKKSEEEEGDETGDNSSFIEILNNIRPLWGFLIYAVYAITARIFNYETDHYYIELLCLAITLFFIIRVMMQTTDGLSKKQRGIVGFKKVLAAHSFTWLGIQTMFVYMFAYVQYKVYGYSTGDVIDADIQVEMGKVVSISFLILNAVGAILPAFVLEPITRKIGRVKTHAACISIMAIGYAGMLFFGFTPVMIYILMGVLGVGWAATISLPFAIMSQKVDQSQMGLFMGLFNLAVVLPQLVASFGVGQAVSDASDKSLIFIISAVTLAVSAILWFMVKEDQQPEEIN